MTEGRGSCTGEQRSLEHHNVVREVTICLGLKRRSGEQRNLNSAEAGGGVGDVVVLELTKRRVCLRHLWDGERRGRGARVKVAEANTPDRGLLLACETTRKKSLAVVNDQISLCAKQLLFACNEVGGPGFNKALHCGLNGAHHRTFVRLRSV